MIYEQAKTLQTRYNNWTQRHQVGNTKQTLEMELPLEH